jgi:mannose-6-phosphate isomerase-like protein (cupin superfamily)
VNTNTTAIDPSQTYVHLDGSGAAQTVAGGEAFWSLPEAQIDRFGRGWMISEFECSADWPQWEMHPLADEFVYLLSGAAELILELAQGRAVVALRERAAVIVPRGVWHTARVLAPSRMLHVTMGEGTQHRAA